MTGEKVKVRGLYGFRVQIDETQANNKNYFDSKSETFKKHFKKAAGRETEMFLGGQTQKLHNSICH